MPGAFTPTCNKKHLPGYIAQEAAFAKLGISKIVICTTNDKFVNEEWMSANEALKPGSIITMVSDGDGDLVKSLGLSEDMRFGVGVR
jgi:peroxiredoxin